MHFCCFLLYRATWGDVALAPAAHGRRHLHVAAQTLVGIGMVVAAAVASPDAPAAASKLYVIRDPRHHGRV